jgi:hypothetical protein
MKKQVWLNLDTGEFSNSWEPVDIGYLATKKLIEDVNDVNKRTDGHWKLIEYECLNENNFEFSGLMEIR